MTASIECRVPLLADLEAFVHDHRPCRAVGQMTVAFAACASTSTSDAERARAARVRIVNDKEDVRGCQPIGSVIDDDMQDLQKKARRLGGDVALVTLQSQGSRGAFGTYRGGFRSRTHTTAEICWSKGARIISPRSVWGGAMSASA